jgi:hypothetical protein
LIGTRSASAPTHCPRLFIRWKNSGVKIVWQSTQAEWKVLLRAIKRRIRGRIVGASEAGKPGDGAQKDNTDAEFRFLVVHNFIPFFGYYTLRP